ncbi:MAG TPA: tripartite tricarboxylate transporter substrate binding protein [Ramlibacter sp.]|nr:tripartite tricarboxylate transporter substrate binding protein [Ramlibacter sp.]
MQHHGKFHLSQVSRLRLDRRQLVLAALAVAAGRWPAAAAAEPFPNRPVRAIVPFAPGGAGDVVARIVGDKAQAELGHPLVVENIAGGNTVIATQAVARARPDGYTLLQVSTTNVIIAGLQAKLPFDFAKDFTAVAGIGAVPMALAVSAKSDIRSVADLVAKARATSGGLFYSSGGSGSLTHLAGARFAQEANITATHVPFRGGSLATQALLGGQVQFLFASTIAVSEFAKHGDLRLLAVTSRTRLPSLRGTPTMAEQGFADFDPMLWYGYVAPAGTPAEVVERLSTAFARAAADPGVQERLGELGLSVVTRSPQEFARFLRDEGSRWKRVIDEGRIRME